MPDTDTLLRPKTAPTSDGASAPSPAGAGPAFPVAAVKAIGRVLSAYRPTSLREAWRDGGQRRAAAVILVVTTLLAAIGVSAASSMAGDRFPGALARAEAKVGSGMVFESVVRSLLESRAEAAAQAEQNPPPAPPPKALPTGKGMWMWQPGQSDGGNVEAMIARARHAGLTHIYVRTGSETDGFYSGDFLNRILPAAHQAGIRVYGWDFPHLVDPGVDVHRALAAITFTTPEGHRIDGFSADIETPAEGTNINPEVATAYGQALRAAVGPDYTLIATVPRPSPSRGSFPYAEVVAQFDAVAPMVYWLNRQPDADVDQAIRDLAPLGKPVFPVGQAYDGAPEGGRPGVPPPAELNRFMQAAHDNGAAGVSFWSWQAADQAAWDTVKDGRLFDR